MDRPQEERAMGNWSRKVSPKAKQVFYEEPENFWLRAKDFCDHFGIGLDELKRESLAGRVTVMAHPPDWALSINAKQAVEWLTRRRQEGGHA
jgi:hypothetical protein